MIITIFGITCFLAGAIVGVVCMTAVAISASRKTEDKHEKG